MADKPSDISNRDKSENIVAELMLTDREMAGYVEKILNRTVDNRTQIHYRQTWGGEEIDTVETPDAEQIVRHTALALDRETTRVDVGKVNVASPAQHAAGEQEWDCVTAPAVDCGDYVVAVTGTNVLVRESDDDKDELTENDKRVIEKIVAEADDPLNAVAHSISTDERDELLAVLQLFAGEIDVEEVACDEDGAEPEIEPLILRRYVEYAREIDVEISEESEDVLGDLDQDPGLLRLIAETHARIHLRNRVTTNDAYTVHQMIPLVTDDGSDDEPTRDDPVEQIEDAFDGLDECPAVRGFYADLPAAKTHVEYYGIDITLHDRDGRAVAIVDYVGGMGVSDTAFGGKIEDVHVAIVDFAQETDAAVHHDEFDVLTED